MNNLPPSPFSSFMGETEFAEANFPAQVQRTELGLLTPLPMGFLPQSISIRARDSWASHQSPFEVKEENLFSKDIKRMLLKTVLSQKEGCKP